MYHAITRAGTCGMEAFSLVVGGVPLPVADFFHILAVLGDILLVLHQLVVHALDEVRALVAKLGQVDDGVLHQVEW